MQARVLQAYRYALRPTAEQERSLRSHCGARRFARNWAIGRVLEAIESGERISWRPEPLRKEWNRAKATVAPWWAENSKCVYSAGIEDAAAALRNWSASRKGERAGARVGFARFERKGRKWTCRFDTGKIEARGRRVHLPRIGWIATHESTGKCDGRILSATVRRDGARWYVSLQVERTRTVPDRRPNDSVVGIDVNVNCLAALSTGEKVENPRALDQVSAQIRRDSRRLDRQHRAGSPECFSADGTHHPGRCVWEQSKRAGRIRDRIRKLYARAAAIRRDAHHKLTSRLAKSHGYIVKEGLGLAGMVRRRRRTKAGEPARPRVNRMGRTLLDAGLGEILRQIDYKASWYGSEAWTVDRFFPSSKMCSRCGHVYSNLPRGARHWECRSCGASHDRDLNAAANLARCLAPAPSGGVAGRGGVRKTSPAIVPVEAAACEASLWRTRRPRGQRESDRAVSSREEAANRA